MAITGYESVPLLGGGRTIRVRDIPTAGLDERMPVLRACAAGLSCTGHDILNIMANTDRLPLVYPGGSVSVADIKTFV